MTNLIVKLCLFTLGVLTIITGVSNLIPLIDNLPRPLMTFNWELIISYSSMIIIGYGCIRGGLMFKNKPPCYQYLNPNYQNPYLQMLIGSGYLISGLVILVLFYRDYTLISTIPIPLFTWILIPIIGITVIISLCRGFSYFKIGVIG